MRACLLALPITLLALPAPAEPLQLNAKFGYLGEYELSARVPADALRGEAAFSGPMVVRHVGICSHDGPDEIDGRISLQVAGAASRVTGTLAYDGRQCTFSGRLSETAVGELECPGAAVPFSVWVR